MLFFRPEKRTKKQTSFTFSLSLANQVDNEGDIKEHKESSTATDH